MIDISNVSFRLDMQPIGEAALGQAASCLFEEWDRQIERAIALDDYSLFLELTEGSLNGKGGVGARLKSVARHIAFYGGIVAGVRELCNTARYVGSLLVDDASRRFDVEEKSRAWVRTKAGHVGQLERLFTQVQQRKLDPQEAARRAHELFVGEDIPEGFTESLDSAMHELPLVGIQMPVEFDEYKEEGTVDDTAGVPMKRTRSKQPVEPLPPPNLYRVQIQRSSKKEKPVIDIGRI